MTTFLIILNAIQFVLLIIFIGYSHKMFTDNSYLSTELYRLYLANKYKSQATIDEFMKNAHDMMTDEEQEEMKDKLLKH